MTVRWAERLNTVPHTVHKHHVTRGTGQVAGAGRRGRHATESRRADPAAARPTGAAAALAGARVRNRSPTGPGVVGMHGRIPRGLQASEASR
jgi:hypothetical protein